MQRFLIIFVFCCVALTVSVSWASQEEKATTEITLEMTEGFGNSRAFEIVLREDGTALYHGIADVPLKGKYKGTISKEEFNGLVEFLTVRNFNRMESTGPLVVSGNTLIGQISASSIVTSVVTGGKRRKVERAYNMKIDNSAPPAKELLEIENAITTMAGRIKWEKIKK